MSYLTSVGLDLHARSIVACALIAKTGEVKIKRFGNNPCELIEWMHTLPKPVQAIYESGPSGFVLARRLIEGGISCHVGAVSKMLRPSGDKLKTDRRDAIFLARMLSTGNIVSVYIPPPEIEAARDLVRAREVARKNLTSAKHRVSKFLLRKGIVYTDGKAWTKKYMHWLGTIRMSCHIEQTVLREYILAAELAQEAKNRISKHISELAASDTFSDIVTRLTALRGIGTYTALALAAEIGDFSRFSHPRHLTSYLGLVPSVSQSGQTCTQGPITKTGNKHIRKLLVEASWHSMRHCHRKVELKELSQTNPKAARIASEANARLSDKAKRLQRRGLINNKIAVATARELTCFVWEIARS